MFYWALLALIIVAACLCGLWTHRGPPGETDESPKALFDFSGGREEGRQMQKALGKALAESETDDEFERRFHLIFRSSGGTDMVLTWAGLGHSLMEYRRAGEFTPSSRALAERLLRDIPRRYRLEAEPVTAPRQD